LQGGWAKTERVKGTYDFAWLDTIIDDARGRGLNILLETGYGNTNYAGGGGWDLAGGFPTSAEALAAYDRWIETMAARYQGKVRDWAMWNEPDINQHRQCQQLS
jgi:GH35 family endo-1,4-beta-xylanase